MKKQRDMYVEEKKQLIQSQKVENQETINILETKSLRPQSLALDFIHTIDIMKEYPQFNDSEEIYEKVKSSQNHIFKTKLKPLQMTKSFEVLRREIESKIENGFTYQELGGEYKMEKRYRKYLESLSEQIEQTGATIKSHSKLEMQKQREENQSIKRILQPNLKRDMSRNFEQAESDNQNDKGKLRIFDQGSEFQNFDAEIQSQYTMSQGVVSKSSVYQNGPHSSIISPQNNVVNISTQRKLVDDINVRKKIELDVEEKSRINTTIDEFSRRQMANALNRLRRQTTNIIERNKLLVNSNQQNYHEIQSQNSQSQTPHNRFQNRSSSVLYDEKKGTILQKRSQPLEQANQSQMSMTIDQEVSPSSNIKLNNKLQKRLSIVRFQNQPSVFQLNQTERSQYGGGQSVYSRNNLTTTQSNFGGNQSTTQSSRFKRRNTVDSLSAFEYKNRLKSGRLSKIDYQICNLMEICGKPDVNNTHKKREHLFEQEKELNELNTLNKHLSEVIERYIDTVHIYSNEKKTRQKQPNTIDLIKPKDKFHNKKALAIIAHDDKNQNDGRINQTMITEVPGQHQSGSIRGNVQRQNQTMNYNKNQTQNVSAIVQKEQPHQPDIFLEDVLVEYVYRNKSDYENFMNPIMLDKFVEQNKKCTLYVSQMKKKIWQPDKFRLPRQNRQDYKKD
eukprot:403366210